MRWLDRLMMMNIIVNVYLFEDKRCLYYISKASTSIRGRQVMSAEPSLYGG